MSNPKNELHLRIRRRWASLKSERSTWFAVWQDISKYIAPDMGEYATSDRNRGERKDASIIDNTATRAMRTLAAGVIAGLSSQAQPWFELRAGDHRLRDLPEVKEWCSQVRDILRDIFAKSNVYRALHTVYEELGAFGTGAAIVMEDFENVLHLHSLTAGQYAIATDARGRVNTLYREFEMSVEQLVGEFGIDRVSRVTREQYERGNYDNWVKVLHVIEPRPITERARGVGALAMPYREVYLEQGRQIVGSLRESGYRRFNVIAPRWIVRGNNIYGTSPGRESLGDVKSLQHLQLRKSQAIDYQTKPPVQAPSAMKGNNTDLLPGGVSYVDATGPQGGIRAVFEVNLDLAGLLGDIQDTRQRISRAFYEDLFRMISDLDKSGITARQIAEQHSEKMMLMGPVIERVQNEALSPLIEMGFEYAEAAGLLPPPPDVLAESNTQVMVEFVSILAQAQKQAGAAAVDRFVATVGSLTPIWPDAADKVNVDEMVDGYAEMLGIGQKLVRDAEEVADRRNQRAQAQQAQAQAEQQALQATTAKDMASAQASATSGGSGSLADSLNIARTLGG